MLPGNTAAVLRFLFPASRPGLDWNVEDNGQMLRIVGWQLPGPPPSEAEIIAAAAAAEFAVWPGKGAHCGTRRVP